MALPQNQIPICRGRSPDDPVNETVMFYVDKSVIQVLEKHGPEWKYHDARFLPEAVDSPDAIFEGLNRPGHEDSLCYSVRPTHDPLEPESTTLPRFSEVLLVFMRRCVGGCLVYD